MLLKGLWIPADAGMTVTHVAPWIYHGVQGCRTARVLWVPRSMPQYDCGAGAWGALNPSWRAQRGHPQGFCVQTVL